MYHMCLLLKGLIYGILIGESIPRAGLIILTLFSFDGPWYFSWRKPISIKGVLLSTDRRLRARLDASSDIVPLALGDTGGKDDLCKTRLSSVDNMR